MVPSNVLQTKRVISDKNSLWDGLTGESVSRKIDVKVGVAYMHLALLGPNHTKQWLIYLELLSRAENCLLSPQRHTCLPAGRQAGRARSEKFFCLAERYRQTKNLSLYEAKSLGCFCSTPRRGEGFYPCLRRAGNRRLPRTLHGTFGRFLRNCIL